MPEIIGPNRDDLLFKLEIIDQKAPVRRSGDARQPDICLSCAIPVAVNLFEKYADWGERVPFELRSQSANFDFWLLQMIFTLEAKKSYSVEWMDIGVDLDHPARVPSSAKIISDTTPGAVFGHLPTDEAVAYDLYPQRVVETVEFERALEISPEIELSLVDAVKAKIAPGKAELRVKHTEPRPVVTAFRKGQSKPYWQFRPGAATHVQTGDNELKMIVRACKGKPVCGTVWVKGRGTRFIFPKTIAGPDKPEFYF
jgi:hypothetical protein